MSNKFEEANRKIAEQIRHCLPLIEIERQAYIQAESGRLAAIMGTGYWEKEKEDFEIFHGKKGDDLALIEARKKDPHDITITEMYWITEQYKKIERCGTETYTAFFRMMPAHKERIKFLADMWTKLTSGNSCTESEIRKLDEGHDAFIEELLTDPVKVINNIRFDKEPDAGLNGGFMAYGY